METDACRALRCCSLLPPTPLCRIECGDRSSVWGNFHAWTNDCCRWGNSCRSFGNRRRSARARLSRDHQEPVVSVDGRGTRSGCWRAAVSGRNKSLAEVPSGQRFGGGYRICLDSGFSPDWGRHAHSRLASDCCRNCFPVAPVCACSKRQQSEGCAMRIKSGVLRRWPVKLALIGIASCGLSQQVSPLLISLCRRWGKSCRSAAGNSTLKESCTGRTGRGHFRQFSITTGALPACFPKMHSRHSVRFSPGAAGKWDDAVHYAREAHNTRDAFLICITKYSFDGAWFARDPRLKEILSRIIQE